MCCASWKSCRWKRRGAYERAFHRICRALVLCLVSIGAFILAKGYSETVTRVYQPISRQLCALLGKATAFTDRSVMEILLCVLVLCVASGLVTCVVRLFHGSEGRKRALELFSHMTMLLSMIFALFVFVWGINYCADPLEKQMGLSEYQVTQEALEAAYDACIDAANEECRNVDHTKLSNFDAMADLVQDASAAWAGQNLEGAATVPRVKRIAAADFMLQTGYVGVFCPITGECNVNPKTYPSELPATMAHETAHALASAPEDETGFLAFLICRAAPQSELRYSAYFEALAHAWKRAVCGRSGGACADKRADERRTTRGYAKRKRVLRGLRRRAGRDDAAAGRRLFKGYGAAKRRAELFRGGTAFDEALSSRRKTLSKTKSVGKDDSNAFLF